jgi:hypothetical protein
MRDHPFTRAPGLLSSMEFEGVFMVAKPAQMPDDVPSDPPDEGRAVHFATRLALAERARAAAFAELGSPVVVMVRNLTLAIVRRLRPRSLATRGHEDDGRASQVPVSGTRPKK